MTLPDISDTYNDMAPQAAITHRKPKQIPATTGMQPLKPYLLPLLQGQNIVRAGVKAVMNVKVKNVAMTDSGIAFSRFFRWPLLLEDKIR